MATSLKRKQQWPKSQNASADDHNESLETLTLALSNASGAEVATASATGRIVNTDATPDAWLARFGRAVAEQVIDAVESRFR